MIDTTSMRFAEVTESGPRFHEVRLTYHDKRWMSRIVTLPDKVWPRADGQGVTFFRTATRHDAESLASAHLQRACNRQGRLVERVNLLPPRMLDDPPARRCFGEFSLRYQIQNAIGNSGPGTPRKAVAGNLSESGLFIVTRPVPPVGASLWIRICLPGLDDKLEGEVVWARQDAKPGYPAGVGVKLLYPPLSYRARLNALW